MTKDKVLKIINKQIKDTFETQREAALYFKVLPSNFNASLKGKDNSIPKYLLNFAGFKVAETEYVRVKP